MIEGRFKGGNSRRSCHLSAFYVSLQNRGVDKSAQGRHGELLRNFVAGATCILGDVEERHVDFISIIIDVPRY